MRGLYPCGCLQQNSDLYDGIRDRNLAQRYTDCGIRVLIVTLRITAFWSFVRYGPRTKELARSQVDPLDTANMKSRDLLYRPF
jgi:hypothetical protein